MFNLTWLLCALPRGVPVAVGKNLCGKVRSIFVGLPNLTFSISRAPSLGETRQERLGKACKTHPDMPKSETDHDI